MATMSSSTTYKNDPYVPNNSKRQKQSASVVCKQSQVHWWHKSVPKHAFFVCQTKEPVTTYLKPIISVDGKRCVAHLLDSEFILSNNTYLSQLIKDAATTACAQLEPLEARFLNDSNTANFEIFPDFIEQLSFFRKDVQQMATMIQTANILIGNLNTMALLEYFKDLFGLATIKFMQKVANSRTYKMCLKYRHDKQHDGRFLAVFMSFDDEKTEYLFGIGRNPDENLFHIVHTFRIV